MDKAGFMWLHALIETINYLFELILFIDTSVLTLSVHNFRRPLSSALFLFFVFIYLFFITNYRFETKSV